MKKLHIMAITSVAGLVACLAGRAAGQIAEHLGICERAVFDLLECMRVMGTDIRWCPRRRSYYYLQPGRFRFGRVAAEDISVPPREIALNNRTELRGRGHFGRKYRGGAALTHLYSGFFPPP